MTSDDLGSEPQAIWLLQALTGINRLPENNCIQAGQNQLARRIVRGLEIEGIDAPRVYRCNAGIVHLFWEKGGRSLEFHIWNPDSYGIEKVRSERYGVCKVSRPIQCVGDYQATARRAIGWLFPARNSTSETGMIATLRDWEEIT